MERTIEWQSCEEGVPEKLLSLKFSTNCCGSRKRAVNEKKNNFSWAPWITQTNLQETRWTRPRATSPPPAPRAYSRSPLHFGQRRPSPWRLPQPSPRPTDYPSSLILNCCLNCFRGAVPFCVSFSSFSSPRPVVFSSVLSVLSSYVCSWACVSTRDKGDISLNGKYVWVSERVRDYIVIYKSREWLTPH